jgi:hypothetical protein
MENLKYILLKLSLISLAVIMPDESLAKIVAIGDSHSRSFEGLAHCRVHWVGAYTMFRVGRDSFKALNFSDYGVGENDIVVTVFGEIDVRCHIIKQAILQEKPITEIIKTLVDKYIDTIIYNKNNYSDLICVVNAVIPPTDQINNPEYPIFGSLLERVKVTNDLNKYLKEQCKRNNILFFDPYKKCKLLDGQLDPALSDGNVHLGANGKWLLQEEFKKVLRK